MPLYYGFSDLIISILTSDGMPATILESMAMKKPLLVSKIETYEEISKDCNNMMFANLRDINSTANGIINGIKNNNNAIINRAYNWVLDNGNAIKLNNELEKLYKKLICAD
jgi:glycosyltransferase involved in cell wall biosynthesis